MLPSGEVVSNASPKANLPSLDGRDLNEVVTGQGACLY